MPRIDDVPVMRIRLDLNLDGLMPEDMEVLRQYCDVKDGYSREILAPADMTLRSLHYAIMQLFGWLNGHPHCFTLPEKRLEEMTRGRLDDYLDLAGLYFRPPVDADEEDFCDGEEYDGSISFKNWLKKQYNYPFLSRCWQERFLAVRQAVEEFRKKLATEERRDALEQFRKTQREQGDEAPDAQEDAITLREIGAISYCAFGELLERLPLSEILGDATRTLEELPYLRRRNADDQSLFQTILARIHEACGWHVLTRGMEVNLNPVALPVTDTLNYAFDYGDGWEITISYCGSYVKGDLENIAPELSGRIRQVMETGHPLCIAMDGSRQLVQDVGGIRGYCEFLRTINGNDPDEKREMKAWAREMGWTGRKYTPDKLL